MSPSPDATDALTLARDLALGAFRAAWSGDVAKARALTEKIEAMRPAAREALSRSAVALRRSLEEADASGLTYQDHRTETALGALERALDALPGLVNRKPERDVDEAYQALEQAILAPLEELKRLAAKSCVN